MGANGCEGFLKGLEVGELSCLGSLLGSVVLGVFVGLVLTSGGR
jgi:hypothetical protein